MPSDNQSNFCNGACGGTSEIGPCLCDEECYTCIMNTKTLIAARTSSTKISATIVLLVVSSDLKISKLPSREGYDGNTKKVVVDSCSLRMIGFTTSSVKANKHNLLLISHQQAGGPRSILHHSCFWLKTLTIDVTTSVIHQLIYEECFNPESIQKVHDANFRYVRNMFTIT